MLRLWLIKLMPFLGKYVDVTAACCGGCPTCIGAAATGLTIEAIKTKPSGEG
jgi:hypothetical protein